MATESSTEPTVPPPIAVLPTGSSPKALLPTQSATRSKGVPDEAPTTLSSMDSLSSYPSSVLPTATGSPTSVRTQPLPDVSSTTPTEVSVSADGPISKPTKTSSATASITDKISQVPVVNSTIPETATVVNSTIPETATVVNSTSQATVVNSTPEATVVNSTPEATVVNSTPEATVVNSTPEATVVNSTTPETATVAPSWSIPPSAPSAIPVVNSTGLAGTTSLPTGPVTLTTTTSSDANESAKATYAGPESSSSKPTASPSSSSRPSSVSKGTEPPSDSPRPVDSSTAVTSTIRPPPASTPAQKESKPIRPPPPESSSASAPPSQPTTASTPQPFPTWIPKYFTPNNTDQPPLDNAQNITIGFQDVVSADYPDDNETTVQFFKSILWALPPILSLSFNSTITDRIRVSRVEVCNDHPMRNAIALVSFPNDNSMIDKLQMDVGLVSSPINQADDLLIKNAKDSPTEMAKALEMMEVIKKIDHSFDIRSKHCRGRGSEPGTTPGGGDGPRGSGQPRTDTFGDPIPKDKPTPQSSAITGSIVVGAVGFSVMYGAAMFIIARRYKRKKQSHGRSNSVANSQNSSEMGYTGGASPALMGGGLVSREYINYGAGGRDSRGSGRSGMGNSGRTANISAPVAAENSLGWN
ncbi:hypothetical protein G6O67_000105 [Ophiocordyceps sinensis]|nr:hypothetical protein G6O67_000105 [Ophiocordyceps sinensis]